MIYVLCSNLSEADGEKRNLTVMCEINCVLDEVNRKITAWFCCHGYILTCLSAPTPVPTGDDH